MNAVLSHAVLARENRRFKGAGGRSEENRPCGFRPAFMDVATGAVYESCFVDGTPAPVDCSVTGMKSVNTPWGRGSPLSV